MTITNLLVGGLGNQLFEIATGWALAKDISCDYVLCYTNFIPIGGQGNNLPCYKDTIYKKIHICDSIEGFKRYNAKQFDYYPLAQDLSGSTSICLNGYFQSHKNFDKYRNEIRALFSPERGWASWLQENTTLEADFPELFEDHEYVFIGVRRGDYLQNSYIHQPCGPIYYMKAMNKMPATRYYIASDDIEWCKLQFTGPQFYFFDISAKNDLEQLAAMTLFKKYILSNSSFYWWGSYLSERAPCTVLVPDKWMTPPHDKEVWRRGNFLYRDDMTIVERPVEH
jgi:hypothetical protein